MRIANGIPTKAVTQRDWAWCFFTDNSREAVYWNRRDSGDELVQTSCEHSGPERDKGVTPSMHS